MSPLLLAGLGLGGVAAGFGARHILDDKFEDDDSEDGSTFCDTNAPWDATASKCVSNVDITSDNDIAYQNGVNSVDGSTFCGTTAPWNPTTLKCEVDLSQYTLTSSTITCGTGTSLNADTNQCAASADACGTGTVHSTGSNTTYTELDGHCTMEFDHQFGHLTNEFWIHNSYYLSNPDATYDTCKQMCSDDANCTHFIHSGHHYDLSSVDENTQGYCRLYDNECFSGPLIMANYPTSDFTAMWSTVKIMTKNVTSYSECIAGQRRNQKEGIHQLMTGPCSLCETQSVYRNASRATNYVSLVGSSTFKLTTLNTTKTHKSLKEATGLFYKEMMKWIDHKFDVKDSDVKILSLNTHNGHPIMSFWSKHCIA